MATYMYQNNAKPTRLTINPAENPAPARWASLLADGDKLVPEVESEGLEEEPGVLEGAAVLEPTGVVVEPPPPWTRIGTCDSLNVAVSVSVPWPIIATQSSIPFSPNLQE